MIRAPTATREDEVTAIRLLVALLAAALVVIPLLR